MIVHFSSTVHVNLLMNTDIHLHQTVPARILSIKILTLNYKLSDYVTIWKDC